MCKAMGMLALREKLSQWVFIVLLTLILLPPFLTLGPLVEERLFPVVTDEWVKDVTRTGNKVCWKFGATKVRNARLLSNSHLLVYSNIRMPVIVLDEHGEVFNKSVQTLTETGGKVAFGPVCVLLPPMPGSMINGAPIAIADVVDETKIAHVLVYEAHSLWPLVHNSPSVVVPKREKEKVE